MTKKCKIVIPKNGLSKAEIEQIADRDISIKWLVIKQGHVFDFEDVSHIPDFLKEEIKQPMTKEDGCDRYFNSIFPNHKIGVDDGTMESYKLAYIEGWEDCQENERLKHEPKQSFEEMEEEFYKEFFDGFPENKAGMQSCLLFVHEWTEKNRGYNED